MNEGFLTNLHTAELFYRFCQRYKITDREPRIALLREITRRKKATYIRDVSDFVKGKNVIVVKSKENKPRAN